MRKSFVDCICGKPEESSQGRWKRCCDDFVILNVPKVVFMLPFTMLLKDVYKCACFSACKGELYENL